MKNKPVMMKCGCVAMGLKHMPDGSKIPCCIAHECTEQATTPELKGRKARCAYYGKSSGGNNECNYGQDRSPICTCEQPSSLSLPFFEYLGEGSKESTEMCKCGFYWIAHQPRWRVEIIVDQKWYKCERRKESYCREFHAPLGKEQEYAESEASFWSNRIGKPDKDVPVFGVEVGKITQVNSPLKCKHFNPKGPQQYDKFYCGCHSWD